METIIAWVNGGTSVSVAGDWNNWSPEPLLKKGTYFYKVFNLTPGKHPYKFLVENTWVYDSSLPHSVDTEGNWNNEVVVDFSETKRKPLTKEREVGVSKYLAYLLRHGAVKEGLDITDEGWVLVSEVLQLPSAKKDRITEADIRSIVQKNDKQRFALKEDNQRLWIRANQGHTMAVEVEMTPITSVQDLPGGVAVHGTYKKAWPDIKLSGLSPMSRNHVHFAVGLPGDSGVISGMRTSAEILIYLDVEKCLQDSIPLFLSANNVVLSPGNADRLIPTTYFKYVLNSKNHQPFDPSFPNKPN